MSTTFHRPHSTALACLLLLLCSTVLTAQTNVLESDPLSARRLIIYDQIGAYAGPVFNGQGGTIVSECDCEFTGGAATGFAGGFMFEKLTRSQFYWGATFGYENRGVTGRFREIEGVVQTAPNGRQYTVPITFMNEADVSLHFVTLAPYFKYEFFNVLFVKAGASMSYVFSSNLTHTKTLESTEVTFPNGETASVYLPDAPSGTVELENGPIENLNPFQLGVQFGVGLDFRVGKKVFLSPVFQYVQPLTSINSGEMTFSVRSFQIFFEGRLIL